MDETGVIVRARGKGEKRWHYGGGLHTWKATAEETNGAFLFFEDHMQQGKVTPLHIHPDADEMFYVLEGEIIVHLEGGTEHRLQAGGFFLALRGVPHAFMTTTETRLLCIHTPGNARGSTATLQNRPPPTASMDRWTSPRYKRRPTSTEG